MTRPTPGKITSCFHDPRPLSDPGKHVHGAIDIADPIGTPIKAPESGSAFCYIGVRSDGCEYWPEIPMIHGKLFPWCNYFYDMYGGIIILLVFDDIELKIIRTHVIAHSYGNQIFNQSIFRMVPARNPWIEQTEDRRFPVHGVFTDKLMVSEGDVIGFVGNAGYSTGAHVHWEIHHGYKYEKHKNRINPEEIF